VSSTSFDKRFAIKLQVKRYVLGTFLGMYRSLFRGKGIDYDEIRKYTPGDDPKALVWAKLAQLGEPYVKTFLEERDLSVMVALDTSGSVFWARPEKAKLALEAAAILIFSAAISRDRIGLALFSDGLETFIPPSRGMAQAGRLVETMSGIGLGMRTTFLAKSLQAIGVRHGPKRGVIFVISDFVSRDQGWEKALASLAVHNDLIALTVIDQWELHPPLLGWVYAQDPETGVCHLEKCDRAFSEEMQERLEQQRRELIRFTSHHNIDCVELIEGQDPSKTLRTFFERRCRLLKRG
jgi:uncharacterized protein (DUF58 family)